MGKQVPHGPGKRPLGKKGIWQGGSRGRESWLEGAGASFSLMRSWSLPDKFHPGLSPLQCASREEGCTPEETTGMPSRGKAPGAKGSGNEDRSNLNSSLQSKGAQPRSLSLGAKWEILRATGSTRECL